MATVSLHENFRAFTVKANVILRGSPIKSPSVAERPTFIETKSNPPEPNPPPTTPTRSRPSSAVSPVTPRALRTSLQVKSPNSPTAKRISIVEEFTSSTRKNSITEGHRTPERTKTPRSQRSSKPPSSLDTRTAAGKSPKSFGKSSPNGLRLPKLVSAQAPNNSNAATTAENSATVKLPRLSDTSTFSIH